MVYTRDLESLIFNMHQQVNCDELIVISGYVGPSVIERLSGIPINTTVVYGMYRNDSIPYRLHVTLNNLHRPRTDEILYSNFPVHSKCYVWRLQGEIVRALTGSANFTTNALTVPQREILAEVSRNDFRELNNYTEQVLSNSLPCNSIQINPNNPAFVASSFRTPTTACSMVLYDPQTDEVPIGSGLNWGFSQGHTRGSDAYVAIRTSHIRNHPNLFPPKQNVMPGTRQSIELVWDDGTIMEGLLEGSQPVDGTLYPKQLSSFRNKSIIGEYFRRRLGLNTTDLVRKDDLDHYGRDTVSISLLQNGIYYMDFSV